MAITQGRPSKNRANPGLDEINPFRIEEWILQRIETQTILIPLKIAKNQTNGTAAKSRGKRSFGPQNLFMALVGQRDAG